MFPVVELVLGGPALLPAKKNNAVHTLTLSQKKAYDRFNDLTEKELALLKDDQYDPTDIFNIPKDAIPLNVYDPSAYPGTACLDFCHTDISINETAAKLAGRTTFPEDGLADWLEKCSWDNYCAGCSECSEENTCNDFCAVVADPDASPPWKKQTLEWSSLCGWGSCHGCSECKPDDALPAFTVSDAPPPSHPPSTAPCMNWCYTATASWDTKCFWKKTCMGCHPECGELEYNLETCEDELGPYAEVDTCQESKEAGNCFSLQRQCVEEVNKCYCKVTCGMCDYSPPPSAPSLHDAHKGALVSSERKKKQMWKAKKAAKEEATFAAYLASSAFEEADAEAKAAEEANAASKKAKGASTTGDAKLSRATLNEILDD